MKPSDYVSELDASIHRMSLAVMSEVRKISDKGNLNYGHVGTLSHVGARLQEILEFLGVEHQDMRKD